MKIIKNIKEFNKLKIIGGGCIPYFKKNGKIFIILGRESKKMKWSESGLYADFGGHIEPNETNIECLIREFVEESMGIFGNISKMTKLVNKSDNRLKIINDGDSILFFEIKECKQIEYIYDNIFKSTYDMLQEDKQYDNYLEKGYLEKDRIKVFDLEKKYDKKIFRKNFMPFMDFIIKNKSNFF